MNPKNQPLTEEEAERGRTYLREGNLEAMKEFINGRINPIWLGTDKLMGYLEKLVISDNRDKAIKIWDVAVEDYQPSWLMLGVVVTAKLTWYLLLTLAAIGGILYFVNWVRG